MSVRASLTAASILAGTVFVVGCSQVPSPGAPSSSVTPSVSGGRVIGPPITPILAQLDLVSNFLVSANHQLTLFFIPPNPVIPGNPVLPQNALNFYLKANDVLDTVAANGPPITPETTGALTTIRGHADTTLNLVLFGCDGCSPFLGPIVTQASHTIDVVNGLLPF